MCPSCLQCWVSDQSWRICAYYSLDLPAPSVMDSKSSGNTILAGRYGDERSWSEHIDLWPGQESKSQEAWETSDQCLTTLPQHRIGAGQEMEEDPRALDRNFGYQSGYSRACAGLVLQAHIQEQGSKSECPWAQEVVPAESRIEHCLCSHAARSSHSQSCAGFLWRGSFGTTSLGRAAI